MSLWIIVAATVAQTPLVSTTPPPYELDGYWRVRSVYIRDLFLGQADVSDIGRAVGDPSEGRLRGTRDTQYLEHDLRLVPRLTLNDHVALKLEADVLRGVVWGDNDGLAAVPVFAGEPSLTNRFGEPEESLHVNRLWAEFKLSGGQLRVGRQPSQWGLGLLANAAEGLAPDFGEYHGGSTVDRVLFATKPLAIVQKVMHPEEDPKSDLVLALGYDRLVTDAITTDPDPERACTTCAPQILLSNPTDDVHQLVGVLIYKGEHVSLVTEDDALTAGIYIVHRTQDSTDSSAWIADAHLRARVGFAGVETELLWINGETSALAGTNPKDVDIKAGVVRGGYYTSCRDFELELGYAPGDDDPTDGEFTAYPLHPDYNVGLLLYEEVLAARTARVWGQAARGLWSNGGVVNSKYLMPKVRYRPLDELELIGAFLWARANEDTASVWAQAQEPSGDDLDLGYEIDGSVRYHFYEAAQIKLEAGVLFPGKALWKDVSPEIPDLLITNADRAKRAYTIQAQLAIEL